MNARAGRQRPALGLAGLFALAAIWRAGAWSNG